MSAKRVLLFGGGGQLGAACVDRFAAAGWDTISADFQKSETAMASVVITGDPLSDAKAVLAACASSTSTTGGEAAAASVSLDAVVCVAGGWAGGKMADEETFAAAAKMWNYCVESSLAASHVAARALRPGGLLVLSGALAATEPTPGMIGYGIAKAAVHQLARSLAAPEAAGGLGGGATTLALAPVTLDTATNRAAMPKADTSTWTPLDVVAARLVEWAGDAASRPASGSLVAITTAAGQTTFEAKKL